MRKTNFSLLLLYLCSSLTAQNLYDSTHLIRFGDHLYKNKEYALAIDEYRNALFSGSCDTRCRINLFNSYLQTQQYGEGINTYRSVFPGGLAGNDTLEMIYGKMLVLNADYSAVDTLIGNSFVLNADQVSFLSLSRDLFTERWQETLHHQPKTTDNLHLQPETTDKWKSSLYKPAMMQIGQAKYRKPYAGLLMSAVIPGSGKMYAGYWYDGIFTLTTIGLAAWQAYRGFTIYGPGRPYSWIFLTFSVSFYIGNLYGSFKAVNMRNYNLRQHIHHDIEKAFNSVYTY